MNKRVWDEIPWKAKIFWAVVLGLTLFRVALFLSIPVEALANADHDDLLQVNQGCFLFAGQWLGPYNSRTLSKGISFPFFLAVCKWLCMPYGLGLALFYIASILVFLRAIKTFINNPYLKGILYLFFLYSPAMLSSSTQQRAYNIAVVPPTILLVAGGFIGMFLRRDQGVRKMLPWSVLAGFSLLISGIYVRILCGSLPLRQVRLQLQSFVSCCRKRTGRKRSHRCLWHVCRFCYLRE